MNYILRLIRENIWYVLVLFGLIGAFIAVQIIFITQFSMYNDQYAILSKDIGDLKSNTDYLALRQKITSEGYDLDKVNPVLSQLIPETEDYFSVVAALEQISQKSQFLITSYTVRVTNAKSERMSLQVKGQGDQDRFLEFLKNYNFGGGRLITIDKIDFSKFGNGTDTTIDLNFYRGKDQTVAGKNQHITFTQTDKDFVTKVMSKVTIEFKKDVSTDTTYDTKDNPF